MEMDSFEFDWVIILQINVFRLIILQSSMHTNLGH